jgi:ABC-type sugar transport system permease subunit
MKPRRILPYAFLAPALIALGFVFAYPVIAVILESLSVPGLLGTSHMGFGNYTILFHDPLFWESLGNNLRLFLVIPFMVAVGLFMAVLLYERTKGWQIYRSLAFVPYVLAVPIVGVVFSYILERDGVLNGALRSIGLGFLSRDWLGDPSLAIWSVAAVIAWQQTGFAIVLFLSRMAGIDESLYEAAMIDGANWLRRFRHITLPQCARVIEFFVAISFINLLSWVFSYIYVMTGGGPEQSTYVMELYVYEDAFRNGLANLASATSVVILTVATLVLSLQAVVRKRVDAIEV